MLFPAQKSTQSIPTTLEDGKTPTVGWLIDYLCHEVMQDTRKEMFVLDGDMYVYVCL